jgi:hypothetical protein
LVLASEALFPDDQPEWVTRPHLDISERMDTPA